MSIGGCETRVLSSHSSSALLSLRSTGWLNVTSNCIIKDFCSSNPCQNNASCSQTVSNFSCACKERFAGQFCEKKLTACDLFNPCLNGATCISDGLNTTRCECRPGFEGTHCSRDRDECLETPCNNGGRCRNLEGSFECDCDETGFEVRRQLLVL